MNSLTEHRWTFELRRAASGHGVLVTIERGIWRSAATVWLRVHLHNRGDRTFLASAFSLTAPNETPHPITIANSRAGRDRQGPMAIRPGEERRVVLRVEQADRLSGSTLAMQVREPPGPHARSIIVEGLEWP